MNYTTSEIIKGYNSRQFSPYELFLDYLEFIEKTNPEINGFITISKENLLNKGKELTLLQDENKYFDLLKGLPIAYKDNIDVINVKTTNGSVIDKNNIATENSTIVDLIERLGGSNVGKNNMYEYGSGVTSKNYYFGDIINPIDRKKTAGGSSGGSAASVKAGMVPISIGTDTSGSIRIPAACCEVIGLKPTFGAISTKGITPLSRSLDHVGVITRNIEDMELLWFNLQYSKRNEKQYKPILGIPNSYFFKYNDKNVDHSIEKVYKHFEKLGFELKEVDTSFIDNPITMSRIIGSSEFAVDHSNKILHAKNKSEIINTITNGREIKAVDYVEMQKKREEWKCKMNRELRKVDCIITPTLPIEIPDKDIYAINGVDIEDMLIKYTSPFNVTGHPVLSLPSDISNGSIRNSFQLIGNYGDEEFILKIAKAYINGTNAGVV